MSVNGWTPVRDETGKVMRMEWSSADLVRERPRVAQDGVNEATVPSCTCSQTPHTARCRTLRWAIRQPEVQQLALPCVKRTRPRRVTKQGQALIDRLLIGPASNLELVQAGAGFRYSARIHEARGAGHDIRIIEQDHETGRVVYALFIKGEVVK